MKLFNITAENQAQFVALSIPCSWGVQLNVYTREAFEAAQESADFGYRAALVSAAPLGYHRAYTIRDFVQVELTEEQIDALVSALDEAADWAEDYARSDEGLTADYCGWGWKEGDIGEMIDRACESEGVQEIIDYLKAQGTSEREIGEILADHSEVTHINSFRAVDGEIFSMGIGEVEEQLPEEFYEPFGIDSLDQLTEEQKEQVTRRINCSVSDDGRYLYTCLDYERHALILDVDRLQEAYPSLDTAELEAKGESEGFDIGMEQEIDTALERAEAEEAFMQACHETEESGRSFSPFEFFARELNDAVNSEEAWEAYDKGLSAGFDTAWEKRSRELTFADEKGE